MRASMQDPVSTTMVWIQVCRLFLKKFLYEIDINYVSELYGRKKDPCCTTARTDLLLVNDYKFE